MTSAQDPHRDMSPGLDGTINSGLDDRLMRESRERLAQLLADLDTVPSVSKEHLLHVVRELSAGLEELLVADEELRTQAEELAASRDVIDAERERYGELFEFAPEPYLVTDGFGKILEANGAASRLLGVPGRYLEGKLLISFVEEPARRDMRQLLADLRAAPSTVDERYVRMEPRDGQGFVAAIRAASGTPPRSTTPLLRWMLRDVTQRLELEEEVRVLHSEVELLASLGKVARLTAEPQPVDAVLQGVVDLAAGALPGCEVSLAMTPATGAPHALAASGDRARRLDRAGDPGGGPGDAALRDGAAVKATAGECADLWPEFGRVAAELGLHSALSFPLNTPGGRSGCLNLYAFTPLAPHAHELVPLLVDEVGNMLVNSELYESAHTLASHLQRALETRGVIEQAKGVLIARQGVSDEQAFDILRRASQRMNRKLRDVAADLVAHVQSGDGDKPRPTVLPRDRVASILVTDGRPPRAADVDGRARSRTERERPRGERPPAAASEPVSSVLDEPTGTDGHGAGAPPAP